jgi:hypothetical protein
VLRWLIDNQDALVHPVPGGVPDRVRTLRLIGWPVSGMADADVEQIRSVLLDRSESESHSEYYQKADSEELLEFVTEDMATLLEAGVMLDGSDGVADSLWSEWGYLIDLDAATFEVYRGFQQAPHTAGRFADRPSAQEGYYPVALVASWSLANLPSRAEFMALPGA